MTAGTERNGSDAGRLIAEMVLIVLLAVLVGGAWNHRLIISAWTGEVLPTAAIAGATGTEGETAIPLPVGLQQAKEMFDSKEAVFVDARVVAQFEAGHLKGAHSLPLADLEKELPRFRKAAPASATLVVYCNGYSCHDSADLAERLIRAGWRTVFVYEGGFPEWRDAGYPVAEGR